jgi:hypothetical protein
MEHWDTASLWRGKAETGIMYSATMGFVEKMIYLSRESSQSLPTEALAMGEFII